MKMHEATRIALRELEIPEERIEACIAHGAREVPGGFSAEIPAGDERKTIEMIKATRNAIHSMTPTERMILRAGLDFISRTRSVKN